MGAYSILAKYYDTLMGDFDYDGYFEFVKDKIAGEGVDLACGSGRDDCQTCKSRQQDDWRRFERRDAQRRHSKGKDVGA